MIIELKSVVQDTFSPIYGRKLGEQITEKYKDGEVLTLDFNGVSTFTSLFFNAMFNVIKNNYIGDNDSVREAIQNIRIVNIDNDDLSTLKRSRDSMLNKLDN